MKCSYCLILILFIQNLYSNEIIKNGFLDLSNTDKKIISLKGEWEFYWNEFLNLEEIKNKYQKKYCYVPRNWFPCNPNSVGQGYATYYLKIKIPESWLNRYVGIYIPTIGTSYELFVNQKFITKIGEIHTNEMQKPMYGNQFVYWYADQLEQNIVIYVSNFHHRSGGLWYNIEFGLRENLEKNFFLYIFYDLFVFSSVFIIGMFHLGVFFQKKYIQTMDKDRSEKNLLLFSIFCFLISIRALLTNHYVIYRILPENWINWFVFVRIEYLTHILGIIVFTIFITNLYEFKYNSIIRKITLIGNTFFLLEVIITHPYVFTSHLIYNQILILIISLYILFLIFYHTFKKTAGALEVLIGSFFLFIAMINDIFYARTEISSAYLFPFGLVLFFLLQSFMLSKIFEISFFRIKELFENLKQENILLSKFLPKDLLEIFEIKTESIQNQTVEKELVIIKILFLPKEKNLNHKISGEFFSETLNLLNSYEGILHRYDNDAFIFIFPKKFDTIFYFLDSFYNFIQLSYKELKEVFDFFIMTDIQKVELKSILVNQKINFNIDIPQLEIFNLMERISFDLSFNFISTGIFIEELFVFKEIEEVRFLLSINFNHKRIPIWEIYYWDEKAHKKNLFKNDINKAIELFKEKKFKESSEIFCNVLNQFPEDFITVFYLNQIFIEVQKENDNNSNFDFEKEIYKKTEIKIIDNHHLFFEKTLYQLKKLIHFGEIQEEVIKKILDKMEVYSKIHFAIEEMLMKKWNYHKLDLHIEEHKGFISSLENFRFQITDLKNKKEEALLNQIYNDLLNYLTSWIFSHLQYADVEGYSKEIPDKERWKKWIDFEFV